MNSQALRDLLAQKGTLVIDGATGTNLQKRGLPVGTAPESWVLEKPEAIAQLYRDFIDAGSDIILTCTFGGNRTRLTHAGLQDQAELINTRAVELAKDAAKNHEVLIGGSLGPTGEMMAPYGALSEQEAFEIYHQQAAYLNAAGLI